MSQITLPENWIRVRLDDIATIAYGKALTSEARLGKGGVAVYASSGLVGEHDSSLHRGPSIVIGRKGAVGAIHYVKGPFWCIDTAFYLDGVKPVIDLKFLSYCLNSLSLERLSITAAVPGISRKDLESVQLPLPPLSEQRRIVAILREADALRRLRWQADERARDVLPALYRKMFGDPLTNERGWKTAPLGQFISFITSGSRGWAKYYSSKGAKFIRVQNLTNHRLNLADIAFVSPPNSAETDRCRIQVNDLLTSITGVVGLTVIAPPDLGESYISQHVALVRLRPNTVRPEFVAAFISDQAGGQVQINRTQYGQIKPGLSLEDIRRLEIPLPPEELQVQFASLLEELRSLEREQPESQPKLEALFQSLLARAFNGELTAAWRKQHAEMLHEESVQRDITLGLRGAEPTLDDIEAGRITGTEREEIEQQLQHAREQLSQSTSPLLRSLADEMFGNQASSMIETLLGKITQKIDWDNFQAGMPEEIRLQLSQIADNFRSIQQEVLHVPALQQSPELATRMVSALGQVVHLYQRAQVIAGNRAVRDSFDRHITALIDRIAQAPAYFRAEDLAQNGVSIGEADEALRLLAALGYVRPVLVRGQARYRRVDPLGERIVVEEFA